MPSTIDETKPAAGAATTASVRANMATAKSEITALQSSMSTAQAAADAAQTTANTAEADAQTAITAAAAAQSTANGRATTASVATAQAAADAAQTTANGRATTTSVATAQAAADAAQATANNAEPSANKSTNTALGTSNTLFPTQNAVKTYADALVAPNPMTLTVALNEQTVATYTLTDADANYGTKQQKLITFGSASATTITIPTNAATPLPIGTQFECLQDGTGKVTFGGAGITINSKDGNKAIAGQYVGVTLIKEATNTWLLIGALRA